MSGFLDGFVIGNMIGMPLVALYGILATAVGRPLGIAVAAIGLFGMALLREMPRALP